MSDPSAYARKTPPREKTNSPARKALTSSFRVQICFEIAEPSGPAYKEGLDGEPRAISLVSQNLRPLQGAGSILLHYVTYPFEDISNGNAVRSNYMRAQMLHTRPKSDKPMSAENATTERVYDTRF